MSAGRFAHDARNASPGRRRGLIAVCAVVASAFLAACGSDSSTTGPGTQKTPDGSYSISTINSAPLPVAISLPDTGGYKLEVMSGTIALTTSGQYSIVTNFRESLTSVGIVNTYTDSTGGTWTMAPGTTTIQFTDGSDGSKDQATWTNGQLTFVEPGVGSAQLTYLYKLK